MRIGILSREFPPLTHVGGIATYSAAAARLLAGNGHEVHVVCNGPEAAVERDRGVTVHRVPMLDHHFRPGRLGYPWRYAYRRHLPHYLDALTWARTAAAYVAERLDFASFDAWEYPETMGEGALLPEVRPGSGPARICRIHTGWMDAYADNALERALILRLQRKACRKASRVVSPTRHMAGPYARDILRFRGPVAVNRNPLGLWDAPVDWSAKSMDHVLYVGRVEWRKGLQVLLRALDGMGDAADGLKVRVVGHRHPPTRKLDRDCQDLLAARLAGRNPGEGPGPGRNGRGRGYTLEYAGPCPHEAMPEHYDWAGILVLPSLMENYPYTALEGLSRGCYLIGSEVGGLPEIIDRPGRGRLFPVENSAILGRIMGECRRRGKGSPAGGDRGLPGDPARNVEEMRVEFGPEACYRRLMEAYGMDGSDLGERASRQRISPD